jgi:hypothetical protein
LIAELRVSLGLAATAAAVVVKIDIGVEDVVLRP